IGKERAIVELAQRGFGFAQKRRSLFVPALTEGQIAKSGQAMRLDAPVGPGTRYRDRLLVARPCFVVLAPLKQYAAEAAQRMSLTPSVAGDARELERCADCLERLVYQALSQLELAQLLKRDGFRVEVAELAQQRQRRGECGPCAIDLTLAAKQVGEVA